MYKHNKYISIPFANTPTIVLVVLKLTDYITWSWWWVLAPMWVSFLLAVIIMSAIFFVNWLFK